MKPIFRNITRYGMGKTLLIFFFLIFAQPEGFGQMVYTSNGTCTPASLNTSTCWNVSGSCSINTKPITGVKSSTYTIEATSSCPVEIIINDNVELTGNLELSDYVSIKINPGGALNVSGNITKLSTTASSSEPSIIQVDGGSVSIGGSFFILKGGPDTTRFEIDLMNEANFTLAGGIDLANESKLEIDGDGTSNVISNDLTINQNVLLNILSGGGLRVDNLTKYAGNSSTVNVYGYFETYSLEITGGGKGVELNALGSSTVLIKQNVDIKGESTIAFGGTSSVNVEGNLNITGNSDIYSETGGLFLSGSTTLTVGGDVNVTGNAILDMKETAETTVTGSVYLSGNGVLSMQDHAVIIVEGGCGTYEDVTCSGGLFVDGSAEFIEVETAEAYICGQKPLQNNNEGATVTEYCDPNNPEQIPGYNCALYTSCRILSVEFIDFTVSLNVEERKNILFFSTGSEKDNSHFEIERSLDGTKTFTKIGELNGSGWKDTITEYTFEDDDLPVGGGNLFYRIKQVDFGGAFIFSKIIANRIPSVSFTSGVWRAYPNPSIDNHLKLGLLDATQYNGEPVSVRIIQPLSLTASYTASELNQINQQLQGWINQIPSGLFVLEVIWGEKIDHIKVLKR